MKTVLSLVVASMMLASPVLACSGEKAATKEAKSDAKTKTADKGQDGKKTT
ncbi:MAG TPA: hypothetical protein PLA87_17130 [Pseudomonadota bacterium]|jgi:hypothetical protein|nr:hypothetical protein [Pseudomonadota bacterium]